MRDAPCDEEQGPSRSRRRSIVVEEQLLRKGILLVIIWQEVLKVKFAGEKKDLLFGGRLDEFQREMWLLLVAAGSGYLAKCWHKTLKPNDDDHLQFSDHAYHEDPDERPGSPNYSNQRISDSSSSPNGMRYASRGQHVSPRSATQASSFHSKGLNKKLFADGNNQGQPRTDSGDPDENQRLTGGGGGGFDGTRADSKRNPWSTVKAKKQGGSVDDAVRESSSGILKRTGDKFRWVSRGRRKSSSSDNASTSSRLQELLPEGEQTPASGAGSSGREFVSGSQSQNESIGLDGPPTGLFVTDANVGKNGSQHSEDGPSKGAVWEKIFQFEQGKSGAITAFNAASSATNDESSSAGAKEEKGNHSLKAETVNAVLSLRAANLAHAQAQALERKKLRNQKPKSSGSSSQEQDDVLPGGKGKRRTDLGKVPENQELPAFFSGKRSTDSIKPFSQESSGLTSANLSGKRIKDNEEAGEESDDLASVFGPIDLSQVFFGFDSLYFDPPKDEKSPVKGSRKSKYTGRYGNRNLRRIRESPKPVSAIESALRAQESREVTPYVSRALNFAAYEEGASPSSGRSEESLSPSPSSTAQEFVETKVSSLESGELKGVIGLPALRTPRKKGSSPGSKGAQSYKGGLELVIAEPNFPRSVISEETERIYPSQSRLNDVVWRRTSLPVFLKKRKVSQGLSPSSIPADTSRNAYEFEALVIPPMEGLLFSFGVGIGVMSSMESSEDEIRRLGRLLRESEEKVDHLNELLRESRQITADFGSMSPGYPVLTGNMSADGHQFVEVGNNKPQRNVLALVPVMDEPGRNDFLRKEAPETPQQIEHMAELEAELEAQLGLLTGGLSDYNGTPDFEELDPEGVAGVASNDLVVDGLPAVLDWDDDNDDFVPADVPTHSGGGVPPRELARLLRKVQNSRQERQLHELEADLIEAEEKLQKMEKELQELKERVGSSSALPHPDNTIKTFDSATKESESGDVREDVCVPEPLPESREDKGPEVEERDIKPSDGAPVGSESGTLEASPVLPERSSPSRRLTASLSIRGSVKSLMLTEETSETAAQAANDAVCDEFLSSVLGNSLEADKLGGVQGEDEDDEDLGSPEFSVSVIEMPLSPGSSEKTKESLAFSSSTFRTSAVSDPGPFSDVPTVTSGEDLDQVVGELLKRDSNSVKNAIKEFLLWERAEADGSNPTVEELVEDEEAAAPQTYSRRAAGKNSTPQKSIISARLEQLARSTFTSEKRGKSTEVPPQPLGSTKLDDTTTKVFSLHDLEPSAVINDLPARRETRKSEASNLNIALKEGASSRAASAELSATDSDFQSLLEKRRELRYASSKVGLSLAGAPSAPERDPGTYYRQREDPNRAGTNSPIKKLSVKNLFSSSRKKNTRIPVETQNNNRLYQNPMSDWLAEVGSPPSESS
ncbi:hypothetical protein R1flu_003583 [Riccia fluitans]|uniref:Uncharacterized protein n=1 Tax=Riccia fluitans TaxID=41844 RepID=A0ABD1Y9F6_9MARC